MKIEAAPAVRRWLTRHGIHADDVCKVEFENEDLLVTLIKRDGGGYPYYVDNQGRWWRARIRTDFMVPWFMTRPQRMPYTIAECVVRLNTKDRADPFPTEVNHGD